MANPTEQTQVSSLRQRRQELIRKLAWVERNIAKIERRLEKLGGNSSKQAA